MIQRGALCPILYLLLTSIKRNLYMFIGLPPEGIISNEAISFQGASPLAIELTKLFQSVLDYRDSIRKTSKNIKSDVYKFHLKNVVSDFPKIVKKHTGLIVRQFETTRELTFGFMCMLSFGDDAAQGNALSMTAVDKYSGRLTNEWSAVTPTSEAEVVKALTDISTKLNKTTGQLAESSFKIIDTVEDLCCNISFCYISAYLAKDVIHAESQEMTAPELAALMLHEIGHMLSAVEHAADLIRAHGALVESVSVGRQVTVDSSVIARAASQGTRKVKSVDKDSLAQLDRLDTSASNIEDVETKSGIVGKALSILNVLKLTALGLVKSTVKSIMFRSLALVFGTNMELSKILNMYKTKLSDFMSNFGDNCMVERYADEYVSRHGFAKYQVSVVSKLPKMLAVARFHDVSGARESVLVYQIAKFRTYVICMMFGLGADTDGSYENEADRALSLMRDVLKVFKTTNLPPELLDFYIKDYEETKDMVKATKPGGLSDKLMSINIFLTKTLTFPSLIKLIVAGRADSNYVKLMKAAQELSSSELHYYSAKLDQLGR